MGTNGKTGSGERKRGLRYPVEFVASELGVDRKVLVRRCEATGFHANGAGLTFREAYEALSSRSEDVAAIRRKRIADAEGAELDTLKKRGLLGYLSDFAISMKDWATRYRVGIESATYIPQESRRRLIRDLHEIKAVQVGPAK